MKMRTLVAGVAVALAGCAGMQAGSDGGWTTVYDGKSLAGWNRVGDANWRIEDGLIVADKGRGFIVLPQPYKDFQIRVEFWADHNTNSGVFIRSTDPKKIGSVSSYEVNIYDQRPGPEYGTAAIVDFAKVPVPSKYLAGGKWNTFLITAKGSQLTVEFNGEKTVDIQNAKFPQGPFALQYGMHGKVPGGAIKFRKVQVREL